LDRSIDVPGSVVVGTAFRDCPRIEELRIFFEWDPVEELAKDPGAIARVLKRGLDGECLIEIGSCLADILPYAMVVGI
jgi:hypothetical protein